jgi:hypothetical protein
VGFDPAFLEKPMTDQKILQSANRRWEAPKPGLMSVPEAAARLSVGVNTIRRHMPIIRLGERTLVRVADVEALIKGGSDGQAS